MIEEIPMDYYDNEAYDDDEDDVHNTAYISDENAYDSTTLGTSIPATEYDRFRLSGKDLQFEKSDGQYVSLTNSCSGKFLESSEISGRLKASLARDLLNIETKHRLVNFLKLWVSKWMSCRLRQLKKSSQFL